MRAQFIESATTPSTLPIVGQVELAVIGRSNVGKSSLLGQLLGQEKLVRVSRTPGRTQLINLFQHGDLAWVDLPGYGYAKVSHTQRAAMRKMIESYLRERDALAGVLLLLDARRDEVSAQDREMSHLVLSAGRAMLPVVTKIDLIPKPRRLHQLAAIEKGLGVPRGFCVSCSSHSGEGLDKLKEHIGELVAAA